MGKLQWDFFFGTEEVIIGTLAEIYFEDFPKSDLNNSVLASSLSTDSQKTGAMKLTSLA